MQKFASLTPFTARLPCGSLYGVARFMAEVRKSQSAVPGTEEYVCQCPRCLTLETLLFRGGVLVPTIKFAQGEDGGIYHNCNGGLVEPCRLFHN